MSSFSSSSSSTRTRYEIGTERVMELKRMLEAFLPPCVVIHYVWYTNKFPVVLVVDCLFFAIIKNGGNFFKAVYNISWIIPDISLVV